MKSSLVGDGVQFWEIVVAWIWAYDLASEQMCLALPGSHVILSLHAWFESVEA